MSGKVLSVIRTEASTKQNLTFDYDASGQRIAKHVHEKDGTVKSTYYVRDASGNVMSVYTATNTQTASVKEQYIYGSSRIGVYNAALNTTSNARTLGLRHYELTDHLGNVRVVLSDYKQDVISATDYYPFGMVIEGRRVLGNEKYRYGAGTQEEVEEMSDGHYTALYWEYDSRLGRRWNVDPEFKSFAWQSVYACFNNNPIYFNDPLGNEPPKSGKVKKDQGLTQFLQENDIQPTDGKTWLPLLEKLREANPKAFKGEYNSNWTNEQKWNYFNSQEVHEGLELIIPQNDKTINPFDPKNNPNQLADYLKAKSIYKQLSIKFETDGHGNSAPTGNSINFKHEVAINALKTAGVANDFSEAAVYFNQGSKYAANTAKITKVAGPALLGVGTVYEVIYHGELRTTNVIDVAVYGLAAGVTVVGAPVVGVVVVVSYGVFQIYDLYFNESKGELYINKNFNINSQ